MINKLRHLLSEVSYFNAAEGHQWFVETEARERAVVALQDFVKSYPERIVQDALQELEHRKEYFMVHTHQIWGNSEND